MLQATSQCQESLAYLLSFLRQCLFLNLTPDVSTRLAGQLNPRTRLSLSPSTGMNALCHTWHVTWVLGIKPQGLTIEQQTLYPLSHLPSPAVDFGK